MMFRVPSHVTLRSPKLRSLRAAIVGTGYIADFHARAIRQVEGVELASVCDANLSSARSFAAKWGVPETYDSFAPMLRDQRLHCVHVLVPPDQHHSVARMALESGVHVFVEKPLCISLEQADELLELARYKRLRLGVNHNMLYAGAYQRLRQIVRSGILGPLDYIGFNHFLELAPIRFGPFESWMLRSPRNVILEIAPHLLSALIDLVGKPKDLIALADRRIDLPSGTHVFRRWHVHTNVDRTSVDININIGPGFSQRTINVRGLLGSATADLDANTCTVDRRTPRSTDLDRFERSQLIARQMRSQARKTLGDYVLSRLKLRSRGNPYQITFLDSVAAFYSGVRTDTELDRRISASHGRDVVDLCGRIVRATGIEAGDLRSSRHQRTPAVRPTVLVTGAAGFIGRELVHQLLAADYCVRAVVHNSRAVLEQLDSDNLEIVRCDMRADGDLKAAMEGIHFVYHLARSNAKTWEEYVKYDVEPMRLIGNACLAAGVKRLIYTGTIDSYYAGARAGTITEQTPLDRHIERRNYYARSKAAAESILMDMHRTKGLSVTIFRPGIVIGRGGNPFHWGVAMWVSEGVCQLWGEGDNNKLPFVLVSDVAAALVRGIQLDGLEGRSYNLVDIPLLTAREYLNELQRRSGMRVTVLPRPIWRFYLTDLTKWLVKVVVRHPDRNRIPSYFDWESRTQKAHFDCTRARAELGWMPASDRERMLEEGIGGSLQSWLAACE
jgi:predicted dehydrogenase/nucleoside-diphosphate-sugar epimerase